MRPTQLVLFTIFALSAVSAALAFNRYYVDRDYWVYAEVDCDPALHSCFIGDGETTPNFYEHMQRKAYAIPACDGWKDECKVLTCAPVESDELCSIAYCSTDAGDQCYTEQHK